MQAGETLNFLSVPDDLSTPETLPITEREQVWGSFCYLVQVLIHQASNGNRSLSFTDQEDNVEITEASYQLMYSDGSYLHLVPFMTKVNDIIESLGLSIQEHDENDNRLSGYMYETVGSTVLYTSQSVAPIVDDEDNGTEVVVEGHFSMVDAWEEKLQVSAMRASDDPEEREEAEERWADLDEAVVLTLTEQQLMFNRSELTLEELQQTAHLFYAATPFEIPKAA